jgi:hypothetical protein
MEVTKTAVMQRFILPALSIEEQICWTAGDDCCSLLIYKGTVYDLLKSQILNVVFFFYFEILDNPELYYN